MDNFLEKFNAVQTEVASLLEGIKNEKNEIKTLRDKLGLRLKKSHIKIKVLRRQVEFYEVAHSKLKKIFLYGLEVFKKVDFRSNASIELNKFSLEVLQKHFLEYTNEVDSLSEIPTEQQLEHFQKNKKFLEDSKAECRRIIVSSSDSDDGDPDETNLEFGTACNPNKSGGGTEEELLRDSGLESVKEEIGANDIDFVGEIHFDEDFFLSTEFAAGDTKKGGSEVVKCGNVTDTQNIAVLSTGVSNTANGSLVVVKPEIKILDENQPNPEGNQNPQGRNIPESLRENCQSNEPARGINNTTVLDKTPRPETPIPAVFNHSRKLHDSSVQEKGLCNSSREKHCQGVTRHETYTSDPRCFNIPVTATTDDMTATIMNPGGRSPVFKDCYPRRPSDGHIEDFSRNCSTPVRQLNENFGRTSFILRACAKKEMFSRGSTYKKPRQEEDGPEGATKFRVPFLNMERFNGKNQEQGMRSRGEDVDRENEDLERDRLSDYSMYNNTTEEDDDDDDDIIYGSPGKVSQLYLNPRRQNVKREVNEEPSCQPVPQKSAAPDLDETFVSPSVVKKCQISRGMGPPLHLPPGHRTCEVSSDCDSVPFAYQRGPVRKRAERMKLPGQACAECDKYYNNVYGDANTSDYHRMLNKCSRHRGGQDETPPGYWTPFLTGNEEA